MDGFGCRTLRLRSQSLAPEGLRKQTFKPFTVRLLLVAEEYRNHDIGTFLLKNTIELALRDSCDAVFYTATSQSGDGS